MQRTVGCGKIDSGSEIDFGRMRFILVHRFRGKRAYKRSIAFGWNRRGRDSRMHGIGKEGTEVPSFFFDQKQCTPKAGNIGLATLLKYVQSAQI